MGLRSALRLMEATQDLATNVPYPRPVAIQSPWSTSTLSQFAFVAADVFGTEVLPVSRAEAMSLPAVSRGRHLLVSTIAGLPLKAYRGADPLAEQPVWLYRTSGKTSPQHRMAGTVDDLIFGGWSLWAVGRDSEGRITEAMRVHPDQWSFASDGSVVVNDAPVTEESIILFPGFHEGILSFGSRTIRAARQLEEQQSQRAGSPVPVVELHQTTDDELTDDEIATLLAEYRKARQDPSGATVYTPSSIELKTHGETAVQLLIEGRNAAAIDVARHLGIPAAMLDASNVNSTLTYETIQGRNREFLDYSVALYTAAIAARLSLDDVTPRGTRIAFDISGFTSLQIPPSGAPVAD